MYSRESEGFLKYYDFILLDLICLHASYVIAHAVSGYGWNPYQYFLYRSVSVVMSLANVLLIFLLDTFKGILKRGYYKEFLMTLRHSLALCGVTLFYLFAVQQGQLISRLVVGLTFAFYCILSYLVREMRKKIMRKNMVVGKGRTLLIVTTAKDAENVVTSIRQNNYASYKLAGVAIIDRNMTGESICSIPVVADGDTAPMFVCKEWIDEVLVVPSEEMEYPKQLVEKFIESGVTLHVNLAEISEAVGKKQFVEKLGEYTVLTTSINYASARQLFVKRVFDIVIGVIGCVFTGIIFLFVAPMIYIASPGPIFFSQERVGKNGKKFKMYKFRSMYLDAEERKSELMRENKMSDNKMFKLDFDPRVIGNKILPDGRKKTGIGHFLRVSSLDEFPQFFNVLKGEMSVVGTRPPILGEVSEYELHHRARLAVKPGITGLWQVSGRSNITDFEEVVKLDKQYISEWNIGMDIKIFLKTILVVFFHKGSV